MEMVSPGEPLRKERQLRLGSGEYGVALVILILLWIILFSGQGRGGCRVPESAAMQATRTVALAMFQYSVDHKAYLDGKSSTEVFQKLLDGKYISDPAIFYFPMPGKTKAPPGSRLQPKNVSYDVTSGIQINSPDSLPIVFLTGFQIDYRRGGAAISLTRPFPSFQSLPSTWLQSLAGTPREPISDLPVAYKNNNAYCRSSYHTDQPTQYTPDGYGIVPNVTPPDFDANGQIYRQLTPEGMLK
jgi:hypothetical protein